MRACADVACTPRIFNIKIIQHKQIKEDGAGARIYGTLCIKEDEDSSTAWCVWEPPDRAPQVFSSLSTAYACVSIPDTNMVCCTGQICCAYCKTSGHARASIIYMYIFSGHVGLVRSVRRCFCACCDTAHEEKCFEKKTQATRV